MEFVPKGPINNNLSLPRRFFHSYDTHHCKIINALIQLDLAYVMSFASVTYDRAFTLNSLLSGPHIQSHGYKLGTLDTTGHAAVHTLEVSFNCIVLYIHMMYRNVYII